MQELDAQRTTSPHWAYACAYVTCDPRQSHMLYLTNDHRCDIWTPGDEMAQQWGGRVSQCFPRISAALAALLVAIVVALIAACF